MNIKTLVDVVVHTHWDREWYLPRETTLARLQAVMGDVLDQLDSGALPSFLFDGQTVALRDLLTIAPPDMAARLRHHAQAGRLVLGPWYVSADEFLVSGESLLRNLEFGHADAAAFGAVQKLGYLPDTFGHAAQMPQVLAQFGITQNGRRLMIELAAVAKGAEEDALQQIEYSETHLLRNLLKRVIRNTALGVPALWPEAAAASR